MSMKVLTEPKNYGGYGQQVTLWVYNNVNDHSRPKDPSELEPETETVVCTDDDGNTLFDGNGDPVTKEQVKKDEDGNVVYKPFEPWMQVLWDGYADEDHYALAPFEPPIIPCKGVKITRITAADILEHGGPEEAMTAACMEQGDLLKGGTVVE